MRSTLSTAAERHVRVQAVFIPPPTEPPVFPVRQITTTTEEMEIHEISDPRDGSFTHTDDSTMGSGASTGAYPSASSDAEVASTEGAGDEASTHKDKKKPLKKLKNKVKKAFKPLTKLGKTSHAEAH
jgi:hypothetical protein